MRYVPGTNNKYYLTEDGRIFGHAYNKYLKPEICNAGYYRVQVTINGKRKKHLLHRLMLLTYVGDSRLVCNHIDGNKLNNHISNLEYVTQKQNIHHSIANGKRKNKRKEIERLIKQGVPGKEIQAILGVGQSYISKVTSGWYDRKHI